MAIGCMVVLSLATAAYVNLMGPALEFLFTGQSKSVASLARFFPSATGFEEWLHGLDRSRMLSLLPVVIILVACVKGLAQFGQFFLVGRVSQRVIADLRGDLFDRLVALSPAQHTRRHSGDLLSRFTADVQMVEMAVSDAIASYLRDGLTVAIMLVNCFILDWKLSLMTFVAVPATLIPVVRFSKGLRRATSDSVATLGILAEVVVEMLSGIRIVQAFGMEKWESRRFKDANRRWLGSQRRFLALRAINSPLMEVMAAVGIALAIWWVGARIVSGGMEAGRFFSFITAVLLLYQPVKTLGRVGQMALMGAAAAERVFEVLDEASSVPDTGRDHLQPFREAVRYEGVSFRYDHRPVLDALDLTIRRGEWVALVGASGGGKTTAANLLPRFWDVLGGRITVDGKDVREVTLASLRAQMAIVTQETVIFNDTVRANIAYGRPEVPQVEVERAARLAQAHDFIASLPQGYETRLGERGVLLSGGQRQRIAIARAFLKDAPILILDEATSALDAESEREVQRALEGLMGVDGERRTTLVIAHRLSTIRNADSIVVIAGGRVVETGTHEELLTRRGEYARLLRIYEGEQPARAVGA
ncbi:MAG TPA: ABC transporter ATP-binding protein [Anaeromyxobacteraceae bacterium]|nr:ABC transporter ATP-binding protein [Anaeromyxobacteraceae bacterium]